MSEAAGTLITTHNANYIPPRFMPGYRGHVPTMKFDYAETYGNHTAKYFQDYRSSVLNTSKSNYCQGGYFPTYYTHNPDLVIGNRSRTQDRWLSAPRYTLSNLDFDRREELINFDRKSQAHRDHYQDRSGKVERVNYFQIPTRAEDQFKKHLPFMIMSTRYTDEISLPNQDHIARRSPIQKTPPLLPSKRDRQIRDVYFERRGALPTPESVKD